MLFAHDTEVALVAAAALVNTGADDEDGLPDPAALAAFLDTWEFTGSWDAEEDAMVAVVNRLLRDGHALPQLVRHDDWGYHVHATEPTASVADRMGVEAAMALADVVRAGALDRLRRCAAHGCDHALVDLTRNASRRFCDSSCANREHVAAYRARRAAG
jgi:predicted RNA-binding Zn ribbon-like protein